MRNKPQKAFWLNGYQAKALFDNAHHERKPVISIFRETQRSTAYAFRTARNPIDEQNEGGDRV